MELKETAAKLRAQFEARRHQGTGGRFTEALQAQVVEYLRARGAQGARQEEVAQELGMSGWTLSRWSSKAKREQQATVGAEPKPKQAASFHAVKVKGRAQTSALVVKGPLGVSVEGLTLEQVVSLLRGLA
jgi:transposase